MGVLALPARRLAATQASRVNAASPMTTALKRHRPSVPAQESPEDVSLTRSSDVGLVHDYLLVLRGAERAFLGIAACWPSSPVYTLLHDPVALDGRLDGRRVETSYIQRCRARQSGFRALLPLLPRAAQRLPVQGHELVVSSSSA